jgi:hypothetical protein
MDHVQTKNYNYQSQDDFFFIFKNPHVHPSSTTRKKKLFMKNPKAKM